MTDIPADAPTHCPGPSSEAAGKETPCQGCPNQSICSSGAGKAPVADPNIAVRLADIRHKVLVLSGKGGVGKSTVTAGLAYALSRDTNRQVALLDVDICGPSLPILMGALGDEVRVSGSGWSPIYVEDNLCVMSIGFLLSSPDDAVIWRGPKKNGIITQFLRDVTWPASDILLVDCPPGTSDEHLSVVQMLATAGGLRGAILVTTPQEVALADVRKEINFCKKVGLPILGVVENMSGFVCPHCSKESALFPATSGGAPRLCSDLELRLLGQLPLDPRLARVCDRGSSPFDSPDILPAEAPVLMAMDALANRVMRLCDEEEKSD